ncbi:MAG TPA: SMP-30/gluconolactonase/LRE family protein [Solirubrobacterales bacterium]|nr:SMP-30/gluconolactonase/LRE family protein [Solirubrobacterales bacterium]
MRAQVECVWPAGAQLGESPCWDHRSRRLFWVDIKAGTLHALNAEDDIREIWEPPVRICSIDVPPPGWPTPENLQGLPFVCCGDAGFGWLGVGQDEVEVLGVVHPEATLSGNRFNDGKLGPDGRYWAGTMDDSEEESSGSLYAFRPDGRFDTLDGGYLVTNGPAFSPDGSVVYHSDSARQVIYAFDLGADGVLRDKRDFARFGAGEGYPDGMTTDPEGNVWVALWNGGRVLKLAPDGTRLDAVAIPTRNPTSCVFTSHDPAEMYVTSAGGGSSHGDLAGGVFRVRLDV